MCCLSVLDNDLVMVTGHWRVLAAVYPEASRALHLTVARRAGRAETYLDCVGLVMAVESIKYLKILEACTRVAIGLCIDVELMVRFWRRFLSAE